MLKVESLTCTVKGIPLVKDMTLTVRPGELLVLLGANGAGKSTLMRMLAGERKPDEGKILLHNKALTEYSPIELAGKKALLSQYNAVNLAFSCREIVMMGRYPHHRNNPAAADHDIVDETMEVCGVTRFADRSFLSLSGGEQQRVQLARVLAQLWDREGGLFLLDEPTTGLDILYQHQILAIIKALTKKGFMAIAVLHEINLAAQYADRILMMKNGRRWCDGTPCEVLTPLNIYSIFSIQAEVCTHPASLHPYVLAKEMTCELART
jgi:iron complex transport system ATP-binding protein